MARGGGCLGTRGGGHAAPPPHLQLPGVGLGQAQLRGGTTRGADDARPPRPPPPPPHVQPSQKAFRIKAKLAKKAKQNRPIPPWIRFRTNNTIR